MEEEEEVTASPKSNDRTYKEQPIHAYNTKKPLWWKRQSGRPNKSQRRVMREMQDYCLSKLPYGKCLDLSEIFPNVNRPVWLEMGFGNGDNLLYLAGKYPTINFIGAEVHPGGIANVLKKLQSSLSRQTVFQNVVLHVDHANSLNSVNNDTSTAPLPLLKNDNVVHHHDYTNLKIYKGDATKLLSQLPNGCLETIMVTFPDPFETSPSHRLLQLSVLSELRRVVTDKLFVATDHAGYFEWSVGQVETFNNHCTQQQQQRFQRLEPVPDRSTWLPVISKYEQTGLDQGRSTKLACWKVV